jgi:hypothetical protein
MIGEDFLWGCYDQGLARSARLFGDAMIDLEWLSVLVRCYDQMTIDLGFLDAATEKISIGGGTLDATIRKLMIGEKFLGF